MLYNDKEPNELERMSIIDPKLVYRTSFLLLYIGIDKHVLIVCILFTCMLLLYCYLCLLHVTL